MREIEVIAHYQAPESKSFDVISEGGSKMIQSKVFSKLLESRAGSRPGRESAPDRINHRQLYVYIARFAPQSLWRMLSLGGGTAARQQVSLSRRNLRECR